jgi:sugar/nucleoside kinase (ribokinase family)
VARVGLDEFGKDAVASFESEGIDTKYIIWDK